MMSLKKIVLLSLIMLSFGAVAQKMEYRKLTEGIKAKLPKDFETMNDDDLAYKYPSSKKPLAMLTSADKSADFGVNISKSIWGENDLKILQKVYKATILEMYNKVEFIREEVMSIDDKQFIAFEFTSEVENHKKYTYVLYRTVKKHVYIFNFTTALKNKEKWQATASKIVESIRFNLTTEDPSVKVVKKEGVKYYKPKRLMKDTPKR